MRYSVLILSVFLSFQVHSEQVRCGWLENPTPANVWLTDRDGTWRISSQGGESVDDESLNLVFRAMENDDQFVRTNIHYGFSCSCLTVDVNEENESIVKVYQSRQLPLKQCLEDISIVKDIPLPHK